MAFSARVLSHARYCAGRAARHLGGGLRWAATLVSTRAEVPPDDGGFRDLTPYTAEDPIVLAPWIAESGELLVSALEDSGSEPAVWTPFPEQTGGRASFLARRFAHEKSAGAGHGPITDLLLMVYRRRAPAELAVLGDATLLEYWLERVPFG